MKELKIIVGIILTGLSVLLFWQVAANIWFISNGASTIKYIWLDMMLLFGSGIILAIYGVHLIRSAMKKKKRLDTLDDIEIDGNSDS